MINAHKFLLTGFLITACVTLYAVEDDHLDIDHEEHVAHVHGHATSQITFIDGTFNLEFLLPSIDVFGFEHEPHNDNERETVINSMATLKSADNIVTIHPINACKLDSVSLESSIFDSLNKENLDHDGDDSDEHHHTEEHHHDDNEDGEHSNVSIHYKYSCSHDKLESITYNVFDHFPTIEEIEVQFVSNESQKLFTATSSTRALSFK
ncbi:MAG: DUF2796 domain-containing protein [Gammaproteobacteria bacterium]